MKIFVDDIPQKGLTINEIFDLNPNELAEEGSLSTPSPAIFRSTAKETRSSSVVKSIQP